AAFTVSVFAARVAGLARRMSRLLGRDPDPTQSPADATARHSLGRVGEGRSWMDAGAHAPASYGGFCGRRLLAEQPPPRRADLPRHQRWLEFLPRVSGGPRRRVRRGRSSASHRPHPQPRPLQGDGAGKGALLAPRPLLRAWSRLAAGGSAPPSSQPGAPEGGDGAGRAGLLAGVEREGRAPARLRSTLLLRRYPPRPPVLPVAAPSPSLRGAPRLRLPRRRLPPSRLLPRRPAHARPLRPPLPPALPCRLRRPRPPPPLATDALIGLLDRRHPFEWRPRRCDWGRTALDGRGHLAWRWRWQPSWLPGVGRAALGGRRRRNRRQPRGDRVREGGGWRYGHAGIRRSQRIAFARSRL